MAKSEPKFRPVLEELAGFDFNGNPYFRSPEVTISTVAVTADPRRQSFVYIGTSVGVLFVFSLNPASAPANRLSLIKHAVIANGTPVITVLAVGALGKIILLAGDGFLYLLDLLLAQPAKKVSAVKGGVTVIARRFFSKNSDQPIPAVSSSFLVASTSKKLVFMELNSNGTVVIVKEILGAFEGAVMDLVWVDDSVMFGTKSGYFLYSCVTGQCGLIFSFPELSKPRLKLLVRECRVLLLVDNVAVSVDASGQPVGGSLVFQGAPSSIAEIGSHVVVVKSSKVEVYHKKSGHRMQMVTLPVDASAVADQGDEYGEIVVMSTKSKVICYQKVPWEEQIKDLLRRKGFSEAISFGEELLIEGEITKEMSSYLHAQVGLLLLFGLRVEEAVNHFLQSDTVQPSELFPFIM